MTPSSVALAVIAVLLASAGPSEGLRALMIFPFGAHSHNTMFKAMGEALVDHGHEVVMFSPFPRKTTRANWTDVDTSGSVSLVGAVSFDVIKPLPIDFPPFVAYIYVAVMEAMGGAKLCRHVLAMPEIHKVLAGGYGKFDVVLTEAFGSDCWAAIPHLLKLPVVSLASGPDWPWIHERMGSVDNPSYLVNVFTKIKEPMDFWDRLYNTVFTVSMNFFHRKLVQDGSDAVMREFLGNDLPPQTELVKNTSLILLNRHASIHAPRPVTPNIVHVGGLHITAPPGTLDPALRKWMDGAEHGVVYFSLGSIVRADTMPDSMRNDVIWALGRLKQRVLWKFDSDNVTMPANVRISKWLPQMDVLNHPKTVLFITHGGLMGTLESLHCGVPMLGMPLFADQGVNMDTYKNLGIAESVDRFTMTKESFLQSIKNVTENKRYAERAREVAFQFRDRPRQAAEEAVWWVEYVVRHRGAPHLRPRGADMPLYQYLLLDVAAFLVGTVLVAAVALWMTVSFLVRRATRATPKAKRA